MQKNISSFIQYCETMEIVNEQENKIPMSTKFFAKLKQLIIRCRHAVQRFLYNLKSKKKISLPREIETNGNTLVNECMSILGALQFGKLDKEEFNEKLKSLREDKKYKILFGKENKIFNRSSYVDVDTKKIVQSLQKIDKELETYEKELVDVSMLSKRSIYDIDILTCSITILSEAIQIQSKLLTWKASKANDEVIDLGVDIKAEYDEPSF